MPGPRIDVMLVDDHAVVRMGFRLLVDGAPDMRVVAEAASGEDAVRAVEEARPDVVVMDISMPGIGGLEALLEAIRQVHEGRSFLEPQIAEQLAAQRVTPEPLDTLSEKEFKVFIALASGQSVQEIAAVLSLSPSTVG